MAEIVKNITVLRVEFLNVLKYQQGIDEKIQLEAKANDNNH